MPSSQIDAVEFLGGPFDGFVQLFDSSTARVNELPAAAFNRIAVRKLGGPRTTPEAAATGVTIHFQESGQALPRHVQFGSGTAVQFRVADWED